MSRPSPTLDRRRFLQLTGTGALASTAMPALAWPSAQTPAPTDQPSTAASSPAPELIETPLAELRAAMESGGTTALEITRGYLERIEALDRSGPALNAMIEVNPEAEEIAARCDAERAAGQARGPLHGIPFVVKDNIESGDRMLTSAGSLALADHPALRDAFLVARLREAGAVLLGKTNLSEWANFRSTRSSSGWSGRGGQTRNPYVLDRNPCGSSSGSGAAPAASLCAVAIGTETDGSVVCPSNANGLVGIKPTVGLVSRSGIVPISHTQDTAGVMGRTVADAAAVLGVIAGVDAEDQATAAARDHLHRDYLQFLGSGGLDGVRLGVLRSAFGFHEGVDAAMEAALATLQELGAELVDPVEVQGQDEMGDAEWEVLVYEFKTDLEAYLARRGETAAHKTLQDLIEFNESHADQEMPWFGQEIFEASVEKGPLSDPGYKQAFWTCRRRARVEGIDRLVREHELDAIVAPTGGPAWTTDLVNGDHFGGGSSSLAAVAGYPNVTVPAGAVHGLPVGISIFGPAWSEPTLLRVAHAFERETGHREPPEYRPTVTS